MMSTSKTQRRHRVERQTVRAPATREQRHIAAPFSLRHTTDALNEAANQAFFDATFPGNTGYGDDGLFLYIFLNTPPPQPLPKSFAGVPVIFVPQTETSSMPFSSPPSFERIWPLGFSVSSRQERIASHLHYYEDGTDRDGDGDWDWDWEPLFEAIRQHFVRIQVPITEIIYWGCLVQIVLEQDDAPTDILPCQAGHVACNYLLEKDMMRPAKLQARRREKNLVFGGQVVDDTVYDVLRPGVRVSSDYLPGTSAYLSTTLGARVRSGDGTDYVTVAAHGFPSACGKDVFHALRDGGHAIGQIKECIGTTDVALMQLSPDAPFENEAFLNDYDVGEDASPQLNGLRKPRKYDLVHLDSPDTGYLDGRVIGLSKKRMPSDEDVDVQEWVAATWMYMGEDVGLQLPDSMCGTAICNDDNETHPHTINHVAVSVSDIDAAVQWYTDVLGFELIGGKILHVKRSETPTSAHFAIYGDALQEVRQAYLATGNGTGFEVFQFVDPPFVSPGKDFAYNRGGFFHICVTNPEPAVLADKIVAAGGSRIGEGAKGLFDGEVELVYVRDPWGNAIELLNTSFDRMATLATV